MAHAGLRGEMHDVGKAVRGEQLRHRRRGRRCRSARTGTADDVLSSATRAAFRRRIVVGIEIVDPDARLAVRQQPPRDVHADEAGRAGDQNGLAPHQRPFSMPRGEI